MPKDDGELTLTERVAHLEIVVLQLRRELREVHRTSVSATPTAAQSTCDCASCRRARRKEEVHAR